MHEALEFLERHIKEAGPLATDYHEKYWISALSAAPPKHGSLT